MKIGLFFGSFNPVHIGHLIIANYMATQTDLDRVWLVVSPQNPLKPKKTLARDFDRLHLVRLGIGDNPRLQASNIEFDLPKPSYTVDTLAFLKEKHPEREFALIMGGDSAVTSPSANPWLAWWRSHGSSELRLNTSAGFKDNALYSPFDPQETPYSRTSAEWTLFGLPTASVWQWYGYVMLENVHNFDIPQMRDEQLYMAIAEAKRPIGNSPWKLGAQLQLFHFHQAFDISFNELVSSTSAVTLDQSEFRPLLETSFATDWTASLQGIFSASRFGTPADDYDRLGVRLSLARKYGKKAKSRSL